MFDFTVDTIFTAGVYLPTAVLYCYSLAVLPYSYETFNLNPAQLAAAGVTSNFTITPPGGGGGGSGGTACSVPPVTGGSPVVAISDTTPPELVGQTACVTPLNVDVRTATQTVTYSFRVKDDLAGFNYGFVSIYSPNNGQSQFQYFHPWQAVSGNEWDATYALTFNIPMGATPGTWTASIQLRDAVGNWNYLNPKSPLDLSNPAGFEVVSNEDAAPPAISSIVYNPTTVDVSAAPRQVLMDIRLNDGVHHFRCTIPRSAPAGAWRLRQVQLTDLAGNAVYLDREFNNTGLPSNTLTVASTPADSVPPS